jgi:6-phosphogluconolactonase
MFKPWLILAAVLPFAALPVHRAQAETFAYVGNAGSNDISVFELAPSGAMQLVETVPFADVATPGSSTPLAISPDKHFLYAGVRSKPYTVQCYAIDAATGKLTHIGNGKLADSMANIDTDKTGRFLFSASYGGNKVAVNPIAANGMVGAPLQIIPTGIKAHSIHADFNNRYVFATNLGSDQVLIFHFDARTGHLTPATPALMKFPVNSGPRHFLFSPNHRFVYMVDEVDSAVRVFTYHAASGAWHEIQVSSALPPGFAGKSWAADIHITPDGRFLYTSERTSSTLRAFRVNTATGLLTVIGQVPTEKQPRGFAIDPAGHYLAAVGELSTNMSLYAINQSTGVLTRRASYPVGKDPNWVSFVTFP